MSINSYKNSRQNSDKQNSSVTTSQSSPIMAGKGSYFSSIVALSATCLLITVSCAPLRAPELYVGAKILEIVMNKALPYDSSLIEEVKKFNIPNNLCIINLNL